jgi:hypothetical protein
MVNDQENQVVKQLFIILALSACMISCAWPVVPEQDQEEPARPKIKCCFQDGRCIDTTRDDCALKTGIRVEDCYECRVVWGENKQAQ